MAKRTGWVTTKFSLRSWWLPHKRHRHLRRLCSCSASSASSCSRSILSSLLAAIFALHLSLRTRTPTRSRTCISSFFTSRNSWTHSACIAWTISCSGPCASVSSISMDSPPWTRHRVIADSFSDPSSATSPEAMFTKRVFLFLFSCCMSCRAASTGMSTTLSMYCTLGTSTVFCEL